MSAMIGRKWVEAFVELPAPKWARGVGRGTESPAPLKEGTAGQPSGLDVEGNGPQLAVPEGSVNGRIGSPEAWMASLGSVSSIKYTTNCLCYMHWLSFISLRFIGILPIVYSLYFFCFCTAEALWIFMGSFQLYSHLVRLRSAA